jgi:N-glycosylase/DNA lyase
MKITQKQLDQIWEKYEDFEADEKIPDACDAYTQELKKMKLKQIGFSNDIKGTDEAIDYLLDLLDKNGVKVYEDPSTDNITGYFGWIIEKKKGK